MGVTGALVTAAATGTLFFLYFVYKGGNKIEEKKSEVEKHQIIVEEDKTIVESPDKENISKEINNQQLPSNLPSDLPSDESLVEWIDRQLREADERKKSKIMEDRNDF